GGNLKIFAAGQPETAQVGIEAHDVVAVGGTEMGKTPVLPRMIQAIAFVIRPVMSVPAIVADMRHVVNVTVPALRPWLGPRGALRRRWRNPPLVRPRRVVRLFAGPLHLSSRMLHLSGPRMLHFARSWRCRMPLLVLRFAPWVLVAGALRPGCYCQCQHY